VRLSRCELRDHINYCKNDRLSSYRFYRALQRLKSPMRYICEIFGARRFSSFSTQSARSGRMRRSIKKRHSFTCSAQALRQRRRPLQICAQHGLDYQPPDN
jgi:hypothetical protein